MNRRDFLRRAVPAMALLPVVIAAPAFAKYYENCTFSGGLLIEGPGQVMVKDCTFTISEASTAIEVRTRSGWTS